MSNSWGIPDQLEKKIRERDKFCVYCHIKLKEYPDAKGTPSDKATFEHIDGDKFASEDNIVMCCGSCNSSRGAKKLSEWFESPYCKENNINWETIDLIVKELLEKQKKAEGEASAEP